MSLKKQDQNIITDKLVKIEDYIKKVCESQNDIACEIIIEHGDMDFLNDKNERYRFKMVDIYNEQVKELIKIVPDFKITNAAIHFDETSPHMHIVGIPVTQNCTRGIKDDEIDILKGELSNKDKIIGILYNKFEMYEKFDTMQKEVDEKYRTTLMNFAKCKIVMFTMAKIMEMEQTELNMIALYLVNIVKI